MSSVIGRSGLTPMQAPRAPILPRRWYPYGRDKTVYVTRVVEGQAYGYVESPVFYGDETNAVGLDRYALQGALQPDALKKQIAEAERRGEACRQMGDDGAWCDAERNWLQGLLAGDAGPETWLDESLRLDVKAMPTAAFFTQHPEGDFWRYLDHLTGGCCNGLHHCLSGMGLYEASTNAEELSAFLTNPCIKVMAVSARLPAHADGYVSPALREQLAAQASAQALDAASLAQWTKYKSILLPRLEHAVKTVVSPLLEEQGIRVDLTKGAYGNPPRWITNGVLGGEIDVEYEDGQTDRGFTPSLTLRLEVNGAGDVVSFSARDSILRRDITRQLLPPLSAGQRFVEQLLILDQIQQQGAILPGEPVVMAELEAAYGASHEQQPEESREDWLRRCAEQDFEDFEQGGCIFDDLAASMKAEEAAALRRQQKAQAQENQPAGRM